MIELKWMLCSVLLAMGTMLLIILLNRKYHFSSSYIIGMLSCTAVSVLIRVLRKEDLQLKWGKFINTCDVLLSLIFRHVSWAIPSSSVWQIYIRFWYTSILCSSIAVITGSKRINYQHTTHHLHSICLTAMPQSLVCFILHILRTTCLHPDHLENCHWY